MRYSRVAQEESEGPSQSPPEGTDEGVLHLQRVLYSYNIDLKQGKHICLQQGKHLCNALCLSGDEAKSSSNPNKKCSTERYGVSTCRVSKLSSSYNKHKKSKTAGYGNIEKSEI